MSVGELETLVLRPVEEWYGVIVDIPCNLIKPDLENLRQEFDEADLLDLGKNIELVGQLDEITVFPIMIGESGWAGFFDLHDGERRWRAAQLLKFPSLRAKIVPRPSPQELMVKKVSRVLQTRSLSPETKLAGLKKALSDLGILEEPSQWDSFRDRLGGGPEWPQLVRVLQLQPRVRAMFEDGLLNFTIAQAIGRVGKEQQDQLAEYAVVNKINGRFLSTQMVPYLIEHPEASPAQAFEHTRVGGWQQFTRSPYKKGESPPTQEQVERFLEACVVWERAWETVVIEGLVHAIGDNPQYIFRLKDASRRIQERAVALADRMDSSSQELSQPVQVLPPVVDLIE
ncbi:MAG: ParB N-terminal domain-containing protein [Dehalococcoidia bacterium]|nr:ParB N-terminal domain-containing protein [Dehalococcoidia bacterium]